MRSARVEGSGEARREGRLHADRPPGGADPTTRGTGLAAQDHGLRSPGAACLTRARILIVDDEESNLRVLERLLGRTGYEDLVTTSDPREAEALFREGSPDLVLLDLHMPHMDGFEVMDALNPHVPSGAYLPVLILTGDLDPEVRQRALAAGARDFLTKPFEAMEVVLRIRNLLETRALHLALLRQNESLEERVEDRTRELAEARVEILRRLALAAEYRDDVTGRHAERVGLLASLVGRELGMPDEEARTLRLAATLHDVGKIGIPDAILMKAGPLTTQEFELMKSHTEIGGRILSGSRFSLLRMAREIALNHHERWDGRGYPRGLAREEIPLTGRLVAVADVFDSLTHRRPYKGAYSVDEAVEIIRGERGRHFDPHAVGAFLTLVGTGVVSRLDDMVADPPRPEDGD